MTLQRIQRSAGRVRRRLGGGGPGRRAARDRPFGDATEPESGARVGPPDFVGVGVQKAGTSYWFGLLSMHPDVRRSAGGKKELHYFDRFYSEPFADGDVDGYHRLFPRPDGALAGEWTPGYSNDFWFPALLHRAAPDARLLILLRDPVERFRSGLTFTSSRRRQQVTHIAALGAYHRGFYAAQLERLLRYYPRERILVQQFERCIRDPAANLAATFAFLGLAQPPVGTIRYEAGVNPTPGEKVELPPIVRQQLVEEYRPDVERLRGIVPDLDLSLWPNFAGPASGPG